jgi:hypothetical protein
MSVGQDLKLGTSECQSANHLTMMFGHNQLYTGTEGTPVCLHLLEGLPWGGGGGGGE